MLSDVFGVNGRRILKMVLAGRTVDEILGSIKSKKVKAREAQLRNALTGML